MGLGNLNRAILRGSLSVAAALLLSTAAFAQDVAVDDGSTDNVTVQTGHDLNPAGDEGIAVGDTDPMSRDGTADDGGVIVQDWHDVNPAGGDEGIAVGEPDPNGDATDPAPTDDTSGHDTAGDAGTDVVIDDGQCVGADCTVDDGTDTTVGDGTGGDGTGGDGEVVIYHMDGGPGHCIDCNVAMGGEVATPGRPTNPSEVERTHTTPVKRHSSAAALSVTTSMAQCLTLHPRSAWICEWQNGAGQ